MIHIGLLLLSFITLFYLAGSIPVEIATKADMASVELGYPVKFLSQDLSGRDPPTFPRMEGLRSVHENAITMYWGALWVNIAIYMAIFETLLFIFRRFKKKYFVRTQARLAHVWSIVKIHCGFLFLSFIVLVFSLIDTSSSFEVAMKSGMSSVELGYPIKFLSEDLMAPFDPVIYWGALMANIVILMAIFEALLFIFRRLKNHFDKVGKTV